MWRVALVVVVSVGTASGALAQTGERWDRGVALRAAGRDAEALAVFQEDHAASGTMATLAQVALAEQALGRWGPAHRHLEAALARPDAWVTQNRAALDGAMAEIARHTGVLSVTANRAGLAVYAEGEEIGRTPLSGARVAAGAVVVRVGDVQRTVTIAPGQTHAESFTVTGSDGGVDLALVVSGGVLLGLGLGAGAVMTWAWITREDLAVENKGYCDADPIDPRCGSLVDEARAHESVAIGTGVAALVLVGVGAALLGVGASAGGGESTATRCAPTLGGVACRGNFCAPRRGAPSWDPPHSARAVSATEQTGGFYSIEEGPIHPGVRIGSYLVETKLGSGGMGSVFAARHVGLDKPVAMKSLHPIFAQRPESVQRFVREGRALSKIRHPHVVDVTDVGTHEGIPYLVMELLEGRDLEAHLRESGTLGPPEIARLLLPVIDAVATAHDHGIVHRDLKPSNVFLSHDSRGEVVPKVLDFGIAKILDTGGQDRMTLTQNGVFVGTPYYASPEQAKSGAAADARSDQYSIGAILYELSSGQRSVAGRTPFEVLTAIVAGDVVPFQTLRDDWNPVLRRIVERSMAYAPDDRYPSLRDLGRDLLLLAEPDAYTLWRASFGAPESSGARSLESEAFADTAAPGHYGKDVVAQIVAAGPSVPATRALDVSSPESYVGFSRNAGGAEPAARPAASTAAPPSIAPAPRRRAPWLLLGLGALAIAAVASVGAWLGLDHARGTTHVATTPVETPVAAEPAVGTEPVAEPAPHALTIEPAAALVEIDGVTVGRGAATIPRDGRPHRVRVSAPGFEERVLELTPDEAPPSTIALTALPAEPEPVVEAPAPAPAAPPTVRRPRRPEPARPAVHTWRPSGPAARPRPTPVYRPSAPTTGRNNSPVIP